MYNSNKIPTRGEEMINIVGSFVAFMGAMIFGWIGNLPMTIAMLMKNCVEAMKLYS